MASALSLNLKDTKTAKFHSIRLKSNNNAARCAAKKPTAFRADPTVFLVFSAFFAFFML